MLYAILIIFGLAVLSPLICRWQFNFLGWLLAIIPAAMFFLFLCQIPTIMQGTQLISHTPWLPGFDINLDFYLDGLSLLFVLLITGIGSLIVIYSRSYLGNHPQLGRYYAYLFFFMGAMLGTVLASNLLTLFVFWELTSLSSYLLISFNHTEKAARRAALQGLIVTAGGGLAMLVGFLMIAGITNHLSIIWLLSHHQLLTSNSFYTAITILVLLGAFTKSAQYPFHFWLPNAMQAPTPISAYLHSATMVKLGIYLVARLTPILGHTTLWTALLTIFGGLTMVTAAILALRATDLKQLLAYSTVMALGILMFLLASGKPQAVEAAMVFLLAHAIYKGGLFLNAGIIDHATGTRELPRLAKMKGLGKAMPITFVAVLLSAISMAGLPPVIGFISKEIIYSAKLAEPNFSWLLTCIAMIANIVFVTLSLLLTIKIFITNSSDEPVETKHTVKEGSFSLWISPLLLGLLGLLFGLHAWIIDSRIISPAVSSILQQSINVELNLWHGISPALLLSLLTIILGIVIFLIYKPVNLFLRHSSWIEHVSPQALYENSLKWLNALATLTSHAIQPGLLRVYTSITFLAVSFITCITFYHFKHVPAIGFFPHAPWFGWLLVIMMIASAIAIIVTTAYLASLALLGVIGLCSTLIFLIYSAPDVAMTQLLVDVLTIVIVVLALYRSPSLPGYQKISKRSSLFNLIVSLFLGATITLILLSVINVPLNLFVNNFYSTNSLSVAHGRNIVNVILVDFRAFDTLGEIIVVAIAGLGVYGLLRFPKKKKVNE